MIFRIGNEIRRIAKEISPESFNSIRFEPPVKILKSIVAALQAKVRPILLQVCCVAGPFSVGSGLRLLV